MFVGENLWFEEDGGVNVGLAVGVALEVVGVRAAGLLREVARYMVAEERAG
jgi:hypothetical protein